MMPGGLVVYQPDWEQFPIETYYTTILDKVMCGHICPDLYNDHMQRHNMAKATSDSSWWQPVFIMRSSTSTATTRMSQPPPSDGCTIFTWRCFSPKKTSPAKCLIDQNTNDTHQTGCIG